jgi:hypothetical protein
MMKVDKKPSRFSGSFYYIFFKMEDGKSARTCIYPNYGNAPRWLSLIQAFSRLPEGKTIELSGLTMKGRLVDADSMFTIKEVGWDEGQKESDS